MASSTGAAPAQVRDLNWTPAVWVLLVVVCGALFLDGLDISMMGVALPSIGRSLHLHSSALQWIVSGYVLGYGGLLLLGGRTSDLISRRKVFLIAVTVFGVASVISAFMSSGTALIALRFIKGASAGFTVPAGLSILTTTFEEGPARNRALGIYTLCGASGFSLGLVFGGLLTELGWRFPLLAPGPVALLLVAAGWRVVPRVRVEALRVAHLDLPGALTATGSLLALVYSVVEAPMRGWSSAATLIGLAVSAALMAAFLAIELRHPRPLLRLGILRSASLLHANLGAAAMFGSYAAFQFLATLYVQDSLGWSPLGMAMAFLPGGLIVLATAPRIHLLLMRVPTATLILVGLLSFVAGYALFLRAEPGMPYAEFLLPTMLLIGTGFALCFGALNIQATAGVADHEQGLASGLLNTSLQVGGAVVLAVISAILGNTGGGVRGQLLPHTHTALAVVIGVAGSAALVSMVRVLQARTPEPAGVSA
ncbi:MAG: MFS transporter [Solirubrobacterales bacterium]|nr:MFS transporter [Solirubrobacterales bacterium]